MRRAEATARRRRGEGLSPFQKLEAQARRLKASMVVLVVLIALAPPTSYCVMAFHQLAERADVHAQHVAAVLAVYAQMPEASADGLRRHLLTEMRHDSLTSIRVFGEAGQELLRLGEPPRWPWLGGADLTLPAEAAATPFRRATVSLSDERVRRDAQRIVAVHLLVGLVLGLGVYGMPVRAFSRAVAELKSAQEQLIHSNRLSALGAMYASLAHEVNNPLGILSARAKLALATAREARESPVPEDVVQALEIMDRQALRIGEIMRSLLAFARKTELALGPLDLNRVVAEVAELVEKPFAKQGVAVRTELEPALPPLQGSADHLQQVLLNLLTNARDAMPRGGTVGVRTYQAGGKVVAEVRDTGGGLPADVQKRLFEPFFTTKDVGKGSGLGLSVSYGIVSAHGGELTAGNAPGGGALFRLSLPSIGRAA
jgi:signal transduction histidine kinase